MKEYADWSRRKYIPELGDLACIPSTQESFVFVGDNRWRGVRGERKGFEIILSIDGKNVVFAGNGYTPDLEFWVGRRFIRRDGWNPRLPSLKKRLRRYSRVAKKVFTREYLILLFKHITSKSWQKEK